MQPQRRDYNFHSRFHATAQPVRALQLEFLGTDFTQNAVRVVASLRFVDHLVYVRHLTQRLKGQLAAVLGQHGLHFVAKSLLDERLPGEIISDETQYNTGRVETVGEEGEHVDGEEFLVYPLAFGFLLVYHQLQKVVPILELLLSDVHHLLHDTVEEIVHSLGHKRHSQDLVELGHEEVESLRNLAEKRRVERQFSHRDERLRVILVVEAETLHAQARICHYLTGVPGEQTPHLKLHQPILVLVQCSLQVIIKFLDHLLEASVQHSYAFAGERVSQTLPGLEPRFAVGEKGVKSEQGIEMRVHLQQILGKTREIRLHHCFY